MEGAVSRDNVFQREKTVCTAADGGGEVNLHDMLLAAVIQDPKAHPIPTCHREQSNARAVK